MLDEPAGQLVPLNGVATIDGQTWLSILVLGILQVTGYFLVCTNVKSYLITCDWVHNRWSTWKISRLLNSTEQSKAPCSMLAHHTKNFLFLLVFKLTLMMVAKYSPLMWFSVFRYRSRSSLAPTGLYLALNLSKRWKVCLPFRETTKRQDKRFRSGEGDWGNVSSIKWMLSK